MDRPAVLVEFLAASDGVNRIVVFGATSRIAQEYCRIRAVQGDTLFLIARNDVKLKVLAQDLAIRGAARVAVRVADLDVLTGHEQIIADADREVGGITHVLIAYGVMPDQQAAERDSNIVERTMLTNHTSVASLCEVLARTFEAQRRGTIAVIGSVAGDRVRASNYVYGSSKAALDAYLSGLRNRLAPSGVSVVTIKPGPVDTPMTAHLRKTILFASAEDVARGIDEAIGNRRPVAYLPWFWRWIMLVIRLIPESIFARMTL